MISFQRGEREVYYMTASPSVMPVTQSPALKELVGVGKNCL